MGQNSFSELVWSQNKALTSLDKILPYIYGPMLLTYESDKGKLGVFGRVSGRFGAERGSSLVPDGDLVCHALTTH